MTKRKPVSNRPARIDEPVPLQVKARMTPYSLVGVGGVTSLFVSAGLGWFVILNLENTSLIRAMFTAIFTPAGILLGCFLIYGLLFEFPQRIVFAAHQIVVYYLLRRRVFDAALVEAITLAPKAVVTRGVERNVKEIVIEFSDGRTLAFDADHIKYPGGDKSAFEDLVIRLRIQYDCPPVVTNVSGDH